MIPLSPQAELGDGFVRIHAAPLYVWEDPRTRGLLPIRDLVRVRQEAAGGFTVTCGSEWIRITPAAPGGLSALLHILGGGSDLNQYLAAIKETVTNWAKFGHVLDKNLVPSAIEFQIEHSPGVHADPTRNGYVLRDYEGIRLGIWFDQWKAMFPDGYGIDYNRRRIALDFSNLHPELLANDVNLDPNTVQVDLADWIGGGVLKSQADPVPPARELWDLVRDETDADNVSQGIGLVVRGGRNLTVEASFIRAFLKFDTSDYAAQDTSAVTLYMNFETGAPLGATSDQCHVSRVTTFNSGSFAVSDYGKVKDDGAGGGYDNNPIGLMSAAATGEWATRAIDVADYAAETEYGLGLAFVWDVEDDYDNGTDYSTAKFYSSGDGAPYLELTGSFTRSLTLTRFGR